MIAVFANDSDIPVREAAIVVTGDVLGTGVLNIAQLTRMAKALNGSDPLTGVYEKAGCFNGSSIMIADLVAMARLLQG